MINDIISLIAIIVSNGTDPISKQAFFFPSSI